MPIWSDVRTNFKAIVNRTDLNSNDTLADLFLSDAVRQIERRLRTPMQEKVLVHAVSGADLDADDDKLEDSSGLYYRGREVITIPNDYLKMKTAVYANDPPLTKVTLDQFQRCARTDGTPKYITRYYNRFMIDGNPSDTEFVEIVYWAEFPTIGDSESNNLTASADDLLVKGALSEAGTYFKHEKKEIWEKMFDKELSAVQGLADEDEIGGQMAVSAPTEYLLNDGPG